MLIAIIALAFIDFFLLAFIGGLMWFYWQKEKEWYKRYSDLLDRKGAGNFYDYGLYKLSHRELKNRRPAAEPTLFDRVETQLRNEAEEEGLKVPPFISQFKPPTTFHATTGAGKLNG